MSDKSEKTPLFRNSLEDTFTSKFANQSKSRKFLSLELNINKNTFRTIKKLSLKPSMLTKQDHPSNFKRCETAFVSFNPSLPITSVKFHSKSLDICEEWKKRQSVIKKRSFKKNTVKKGLLQKKQYIEFNSVHNTKAKPLHLVELQFNSENLSNVKKVKRGNQKQNDLFRIRRFKYQDGFQAEKLSKRKLTQNLEGLKAISCKPNFQKYAKVKKEGETKVRKKMIKQGENASNKINQYLQGWEKENNNFDDFFDSKMDQF